MYHHTNLEVTSVSQEEDGPVPQQEEFGSGQPKLADEYRPSDESLIRQQIKLPRSHFEEQKKVLDNFMDDITRYFQGFPR